jgi:hypothetical protein
MAMRVEFESADKATGEKTVIAAIFNERELVVCLFEAMMEIKRPATMTWQQAFAEIENNSPHSFEACRRMARAAMQYFAKQVGEAGRTDADQVQ